VRQAVPLKPIPHVPVPLRGKEVKNSGVKLSLGRREG